MRKKTLPGLIFILFLVLALYHLDSLPGEWYGDISNVHEYVAQIFSGLWPFYISQSIGPFYQYLITPLILVFGQSYLGYKLASVIVGLIGLLAVYLLSKEFTSIRVALITTGITVISFWYLVMSRMGNMQIVIPALVAFTVYFAVRFRKESQKRDFIGGIAASSLGLFTYPQTFVLPFLFLVLLHILPQPEGGKEYFWQRVKLFIITGASFVPALLILVSIIIRQPDVFSPQGYIGSKLAGKYSPTEMGKRLSVNLLKTGGMLHFSGDQTFRVNVPGNPQLDRISGIFFIIGILTWFSKEKRKYLFPITFVLFFLILPSVSPTIPVEEIPNSGRTIGIIPFVYLFAASGLWFLSTLLKRYLKYCSLPIIFLICIMLAYLNLQKYFVLYPQSLPNRNVPFGKITAQYLDSLPVSTHVYLTNCCWGDWGQPEPKAIFYSLQNKKGRDNIYQDQFITSCDEVKNGTNTLIIFRPDEQNLVKSFQQCFPTGKYELHSAPDRQAVFGSLFIGN